MTAWWSKAVLIGAVAAALLLPIGALGTRFGLWPFTAGFLLLAIGGALAVAGIATGIAACIIAGRRALPHDLRTSMLGLAISAAILAYMGMQFYWATSYPPIHNISTDTNNPPKFISVLPLREGANPVYFNAAELAPLQEEFYPWVRPLTLGISPQDALAKTVVVLNDMGWDMVAQHPQLGLVEATATSFWFGFKDDVAVRVRPHPVGARIDVRSVSRVGQGDLGANAQRIRRILQRLSSE